MAGKTEYMITLTLQGMTEGGKFVAICDELDIAECGNTEDEARARLDQAIKAVLTVATQEGIFLDYLRSRNVKIEIQETPEPHVTSVWRTQSNDEVSGGRALTGSARAMVTA